MNALKEWDVGIRNFFSPRIIDILYVRLQMLNVMATKPILVQCSIANAVIYLRKCQNSESIQTPQKM